MKTSTRFVLVVLGISVAMAALMAPRSKEWLAVLRDQGKRTRIISLLEARLTRDPDQPEFLAPLARAYADGHAYKRAIELMTRYTELRPADADGYAELAEFYGKTGDEARQIDMLKHSIDIAPKMPRVLELAKLYRRAKRAGDELALLLPFQQKLTVESGALLRLAELLAAEGKKRAAIEDLMRPDVLSATPGTPQQAEARLFLATLLSETGRGDEVVLWGRRWIQQWHEPWLAGRLLRIAALGTPLADASRIADAVVTSHPEIRLFLVGDLARAGARPVARHLLETWANASIAPTDDEIAAFLASCREQQAQDVAWQAIGTFLDRKRSDDVVARFAKALVANFGVGSFAPLWSRLPPAIIRRNPLLAAQLAFHQGDLQLTEQLLARVELRTLSAADRRTWIGLLRAAATPVEAFAILRQQQMAGKLPADLLLEYARREENPAGKAKRKLSPPT